MQAQGQKPKGECPVLSTCTGAHLMGALNPLLRPKHLNPWDLYPLALLTRPKPEHSRSRPCAQNLSAPGAAHLNTTKYDTVGG